jgi:ubiquinone biosynthesis protein UbiJ
MDIYGIILIGKVVAFTLGPWPEGKMNECERGAKQIEQNAAATIPEEGRVIDGERIFAEDVDAFCGNFEERPEVGTVYQGER